ncbi:hypothetical protein XA68_10839 [Ophiocordyceps unilateralis]|uniref:NEDD8-activating enzyme E1 regulatory subunit n=1 Tax=Ophiocordyceps unilateralis TaxID=268505 RepID=A0A2A9P269_OPHUN|nr:hypothetical protein XA68_10839 [Ophiocordyceps unilateralis]
MAPVQSQADADAIVPSDKDKKYDRQLRLWSASGQAALECANVLLVNSTTATVGVETLKNLVLPGIGSFTIADEAIVDDYDLGVNFFLDECDRGRSRAQCCMNHLLELNPAVNGNYYPKPNSRLDLQDILKSSGPFTIILCVLPLRPDRLASIETYAHDNHIPFVAVRSTGFYSYFHIILPGDFPVVETHPDDAANVDLRLLNPWPELMTFAGELTDNIDDLNDFDHGHLPLVVVLLHYLAVWRSNHDNMNPTTYSDKAAFRDLIAKAMRRNNAEGGEENFEEAVSSVMKLIKPLPIPASLEEIFDRCDEGEGILNSSFWSIARGVKQFYCEHQQLPLTGSLPDMKAQSAIYIRLQNLYRDKAQRDLLELFCKNARFIKLVNAAKGTRPGINQIKEQELAENETAANAGCSVPESLLSIYLALTAIDQVAMTAEENTPSWTLERAPALSWNKRTAMVAREVARAGGGELHNTSALTDVK